MLDSTTEIISQLLQGTVETLDIPEDLRVTAVKEYEYVGNWLADHADVGGDGWLVYPQGSFLLGTVVRPYGFDHYDLDAVCRRGIAKESTTQAALKADVAASCATTWPRVWATPAVRTASRSASAVGR